MTALPAQRFGLLPIKNLSHLTPRLRDPLHLDLSVFICPSHVLP